MNNFNKIYTADTLKKNKVITVITLPMEESIMFPVTQAIDLMKQGENILFFSFNHDSIKVNTFFQNFLKNESNPEHIKGNLAVIDQHQIPAGMDWLKFIEDTIAQVKSECELNYVFFDIFSFVKNNQSRPGDDELVVSTATLLSFTQKITIILLKTIDMPIITATQNPEQSKKIIEDIVGKDMSKALFESKELVQQSDFIIGIQREKNNFWKKLINFLLFWRKKNNFTVKILKNRNGQEKSYRMNLDMEEFKSEIL